MTVVTPDTAAMERAAEQGGGASARSTPLAALAEGLGRLRGDGGVLVDRITIDSRTVTAGALFVALRGRRVDGHRFVAEAVERGAAAIVVEEPVPGCTVPVLEVEASDLALALIAARLHAQPSHAVPVLGVTGTNGKTSITHLVAAAGDEAGHPTAILGTLGVGRRRELESTGYTTPTAERFQALLRRLVDGGAEAVAVEVSSHALATRRVHGTRFAAVAFTNLTRDHLDFHGSEAAYLEAKLRLFDRTARGDDAPTTAVVQLDDPASSHFVARARQSGDRLVTVSLAGAADVTAEQVALHGDGTSCTVVHPGGRTALELALPGAFNLSNALVAFAMAAAIRIDAATIAAGLARVTCVPGRLERVDDGGAIRVFVDYAHTPDAVETVLRTVRPLTRGRLVVVVGCGGDRDRGKRPLMAAAATSLADLAILTSDNPRSEEPRAILADMERGIAAGARVEVIVDRREAIRRAIDSARPGDTVVIAGKGHERVQIVGDQEIAFDDRTEARAALAGRARSERPGGPAGVGVPAECVAPAVMDGGIAGGSARPILELAAVLDVLRPEHAELAGPRATDVAPGDVPVRGATIDSRGVVPGQLFVALPGARAHGARFAGAALAAGAVAVLLTRGEQDALPAEIDRSRVILVDDATRALGRLAAAHRRRLAPTVIAVTGSSGKSTTKEMTAAVLATDRAVHRTPGNYNNHLGVPLTLLGLEPRHRALVVELGMNAPGEIAALCRLATPDHGVLTGVGRAHLEGLGSREAIIAAKLELAEALPRGGVLVLPGDDPILLDAAGRRGAALLTVGSGEACDLRALDLRASADGWRARLAGLGYDGCELGLPLAAPALVTNALLALAVGHLLGIEPRGALGAIAAVRPLPHRMVLHRRRRIEVLDDCYNANPESMAAALEALAARPARRRLAVLGDMLELGTESAAAHRELGARAAAVVDRLFLIGERAGTVAAAAAAAGMPPAHIVVETAHQRLAARVVAALAPGDTVLVKASRGLALEQIVDAVLGQTGEGG